MRTGVSMRIKALVRGLVAASAAMASLASGPLAQAQTIASLPASGLAASITGSARPIAAWTEFCERYASECAVNRSESASITLTPAIWQTINTVNRRVNKAIHAVTDQDHWNVADRWDLAEDGQGDCEDFQLRKRAMLVEAGLPRRAMRMTVVIDEKGEGHAVLTLITDRGDLVLDNKTSAVLPWRQTGYTFIKRESQDAVAWVGLGVAISPTTTANR
ncbi:transglutaminase-like cysteine peptidase [Methylobacterium brachythecii]|uniref:Transglutaminase n=1 Tax=Methylobacterium brachythecii TaxID=1176177 RepID=A0A7W6F8I2_9HYPH|nr:transglutaminase-like cysteine peptidase [Methylobacterium brachythecii]MBB3904430.1 putative transglutaminase-like cysteine proteinase [Methylobacterium brachythecii]GLS43640.1 transglutaminase [Methylobacterium brachythecii]